MARFLRVRFRVDAFDDRTPEVHTIDVAAGGTDTPAVLENPHVDFPGTWRLAGEEGGVPVYELADQVADTSDTVELDEDPSAGRRARGLDGDRTVLLEDVGENRPGDSLFVRGGDVRAQQDAGRQDGGTGR